VELAIFSCNSHASFGGVITQLCLKTQSLYLAYVEPTFLPDFLSEKYSSAQNDCFFTGGLIIAGNILVHFM